MSMYPKWEAIKQRRQERELARMAKRMQEFRDMIDRQNCEALVKAMRNRHQSLARVVFK